MKIIKINHKGIHYTRKSKGDRYFVANYMNSKKGINRKVKLFSLKKYGARKALKKAIAQRKKWEKKFGKPKDISKQHFSNEYIKEDGYYLLKLTDQRNGKVIKAKIDEEKVKDAKEYYWVYHPPRQDIINPGNKKRLRDVIFPEQEGFINHLNRDRFDFRKEKVEFDEANLYVKARTYEATEEQPPGIAYQEDKRSGRRYWRASFARQGINKAKFYNIDKYGYEKALQLARETRKKWEEDFAAGRLT